MDSRLDAERPTPPSTRISISESDLERSVDADPNTHTRLDPNALANKGAATSRANRILISDSFDASARRAALSINPISLMLPTPDAKPIAMFFPFGLH